MPARHAWFVGWVGALAALALALFSACDESKRPPGEPPGQPELPPRPDLDPDAEVPETEGGAALAGQAKAEAQRLVADIRNKKLDLPPRRVPTQNLAFGKERIAHLTEDSLVVREATTGKEVVKLAVVEPRRVLGLIDGALLVVAKSEIVRVDRKKTDRFGRIPLFLDSVVFSDRRDKTKVWVLHGIDPTLYPYALGEGAKLETLDFLELTEFDQKGFGALKDGSFVYTAGKRLKRFYPGGKSWTLDVPSGAEPWRILTTRRIDEIWLARSDGKLELCQIAGQNLTVTRTLSVPGAFDIASSDNEIAVLRLDKTASAAEPVPDGGIAAPSRIWKLVVYDGAGKELWSTELPFEDGPGSGDGWVKQVTKNRAVILSPHASLVAVGGPTAVTVFDYKKKQRLYGD